MKEAKITMIIVTVYKIIIIIIIIIIIKMIIKQEQTTRWLVQNQMREKTKEFDFVRYHFSGSMIKPKVSTL